MVDEPPGVGVAIESETTYGDSIWLYFDQRYFDQNRKWDLKKIYPMKVIGVARKVQGKWYTAGKVIGRYHLNK